MIEADVHHGGAREMPVTGSPLVDPRNGDIEDDASSTDQRSLLAIAGSLLAEISLAKLLLAWTLSILLPAVALGLAPLLATAWLAKAAGSVKGLAGPGTILVLLIVVVVGWKGWRPLVRSAESNFWALNALAVQPGYVLCREALRHLAERALGGHATGARLAHVRSASSAGAGVVASVLAVLVAVLAWPASRWVGTLADLVSLHGLAVPTLANAVVIVSAYLAFASLIWGFADAAMEQPADLSVFDPERPGEHTWRVAHLSDIHVVGERYGFRIESGRSGPRGNSRLKRVMARLDAIHLAQPLDLIIVTGDVTDAGRSTEWAEFLDIVGRYPALGRRMVVLPGNHDVNIVDRANPARLELPFSPGKRLRQMRTLSAIAAVQGDRIRVVDHESGALGPTLGEALSGYRERIERFANTGSLHLSGSLERVWNDQFPMVLPPEREDGLGVAILNSNAETHFSFTNALGLVSAEQGRRLSAALARFPDARWIVGLHHHLMEYPMTVSAFSERIGTALVNGSWFFRKLRPFARRVVVMHGHRHIDWIGACGGMKIISAPSPVMGGTDALPTHFHIHTLAAGKAGEVRLMAPQRVEIAGGADGRDAAANPAP